MKNGKKERKKKKILHSQIEFLMRKDVKKKYHHQHCDNGFFKPHLFDSIYFQIVFSRKPRQESHEIISQSKRKCKIANSFERTKEKKKKKERKDYGKKEERKNITFLFLLNYVSQAKKQKIPKF